MKFSNYRILKAFLTVGLSLSIILSGTLLTAPSAAHASTASAYSKARAVIATGKHYLGTPYRFGARTGVTSSFDCSSFVQYVYKRHGIYLPRLAGKQSRSGYYVSRRNLKPGDLVFFYSPVHHVAIYIGNGKIMHTYGKPGVTISNLNSGWWNRHYTTARRVIR